MSFRGRGRGGYNGNSGRGGFSQTNVAQHVAQNAVPVEILGWNGAAMEDCVKFISRKCRIVVTNPSIDPATGVLKGYVKSQKEADDLCNWSGVKFAGQSLKIAKTVSSNSFTNNVNGNSTIETITQFLKSRYQPEMRLLNLSAVQADPALVQRGFFASISTTSKFFPALMKVASELKIDVDSIDLSNNQLSDLTTISTLAQTFPTLKNLSLANNNFTRIKPFETWRHKLGFLRELIISGNPLANSTNPAEIITVKLELMKSFPRLTVLNGEIIRNEQVLIQNLTLPFDHPQAMFSSDEEAHNLSTNFVANFFKLWDSNRQELMGLYQNESQFSMSVDSSHPFTVESSTNFASGHTDFGYYLPNSRNLTKISASKSRMAKVAVGQEQIFKSFLQLPKTKHELVEKHDLYSMESYRLPQVNGILINFHGSFNETAPPDDTDSLNNGPGGGGPRNRFQHQRNKKVPLSQKSFDRTFVVIPANGSMILASDMLVIRNHAGADAWRAPINGPALTPAPATPTVTTPGTTPTPQPQPQPTAADLPPDVKSMLNASQQEVLVRVLLETHLNLQYGLMLCEQSNWDYQQCTINFKNSAASLPRDAYAS